MRTTILAVSALLALSPPAWAQTYSITGLSADDLLTIGRGLDKLLGVDPADRAFTDRARLYDRVQAQIIQQNQAAAKAKADADRSAAAEAAFEAAAAAHRAAIEAAAAVSAAREESEGNQP